MIQDVNARSYNSTKFLQFRYSDNCDFRVTELKKLRFLGELFLLLVLNILIEGKFLSILLKTSWGKGRGKQGEAGGRAEEGGRGWYF